MSHTLKGGTLVMERRANGQPIGIRATCVCGWTSGGHFSSFAASAFHMAHAEEAEIATKLAHEAAQTTPKAHKRTPAK